MLLVFHRRSHDGQVGLEIQFEHAQRLLDISGRRGNRHQRQNHVAFADVVFHPFLVDGDIAFEEMKARLVEQVGDALGIHVHAIHFPIGGGEDAVGQMVADETVHPENQHFFHFIFLND